MKKTGINQILFSALFFTYVSCPALAQETLKETQEPLSETPVSFYEMLVGNTLVGTSSQGNNSTEYHAPDGRVLGYNWDDLKNTNSCWYMKGKDVVCYYYEYPDNNQFSARTGESCWKYTLRDKNTIYGVSTKNTTTLLVNLEKGNPYNHSDFGVKWSCSAQIVSLQK